MSKIEEPTIEAVSGGETLVVRENPKKTWRSYIWDSLDKSPEERLFIFKLDTALLSIACLGT